MTTPRFLPILLALVLFVPALRAADDTPQDNEKIRTDLASKVLELAYTPGALRDSFSGFLNPALDAMKRDGMPDAARDEMRLAFTDWFNQEIKWEEIKPKLVDLYVKDFTAEELRALLAIYQQPLGARVMAKLPTVLQDSSFIGQQYYLSKQDSLNEKIAPIVEKYKK